MGFIEDQQGARPELAQNVLKARDIALLERQFTLWCGKLKGFGVVQPSGPRTSFMDYQQR
jgi:hypothetical protein